MESLILLHQIALGSSKPYGAVRVLWPITSNTVYLSGFKKSGRGKSAAWHGLASHCSGRPITRTPGGLRLPRFDPQNAALQGRFSVRMTYPNEAIRT